MLQEICVKTFRSSMLGKKQHNIVEILKFYQQNVLKVSKVKVLIVQNVMLLLDITFFRT